MRGLRTVVCVLALSATAADAGDAVRGKITFMRQCSACHVVIAGARDSMGPNLFSVVGRKAGTRPGYVYSDAMKNSGIVWSAATLKSYVMDPNGVVPASNMMFTGIHNPLQAEDVAAYLATLK